MSKSAGQTGTTSTTGLPSFQQPYVNQALSEAQRLYQSGGPQYYQGNMVAGFSPTEQQGHANLYNTANMLGSLYNLEKGNEGSVIKGLQTGLNSYDVANNPVVNAYADAATKPIYQQFREETLPYMRSSAVGSGTIDGSRYGLSEGLAAARTNEAAMNTRAGIYNQAYSQGLGLLGQSLGLSGQIAAGATQPGQILSGIGEQERAMEQANIDANVAKWNYNQNLPYTALAEYSNLISRPYGGQSTTAVNSQGNGSNQTIAALLAALGMAPGIGSWLGGLF